MFQRRFDEHRTVDSNNILCPRLIKYLTLASIFHGNNVDISHLEGISEDDTVNMTLTMEN